MGDNTDWGLYPTSGMGHGLASIWVQPQPKPSQKLHPLRCQPGPTPTPLTPQARLTSPDFNKGNLESITSRISEI